MPSPPALLPRLALAVGATLLAVGAAEVGARLVAPAPLANPGDPNRGAFTQPGDHPVRTAEFAAVVHVNAQGFVDREWGERRGGVPRVLVVGDSFVQAAQVELDEGFGRQLDRWLDARMKRDVEVLSLGVPGAGTATALHLVEQHLPRLQPDLVVLGFLVANDVFNNHPGLDTKPDKPFYRLERGELVPVEGGDWGLGWLARSPLWRRSHLVRRVGRTVLADRQARDRLERGAGMPVDLRVYDPTLPEPWPQAWDVTAALVGELAARCEEAGVGFGVLLFPGHEVVSAQAQRDAAERWPELADWDLSRAHAQASARLSPHAPVEDLAPWLIAASELGGSGPLYLRHDGHWTAAGHAQAAQGASIAVSEWLEAALR